MRFQFQCGVLLCLLFCVGTVTGQQSSSQEKMKVVMVPRAIGLVTVAYQPDCPLQFENVSLLGALEGGGITNYDLRNRGTKSIRSFTVGESTGSTWGWDSRYHGPVPPGELVPQGGENWIQIVPLTKELREKLKLQGPMQGMLVLMITRVEFTDGTVYEDEAVYKAMRSYMDDLQSKLSLLESLKNKTK
jgi:hypothetical protein